MFKKDIISGAALNYASKQQRDRALGTAATHQSRFDSFQRRSVSSSDPLSHTRIERHKKLMASARHEAPACEDDFDLLKKNLKFLYDDDEELDLGIVGNRLAIAYYTRLHKEYVLVDLSQYKTGKIGMRWRTEGELIRGKGQFECGGLGCPRWHKLESLELHFQYTEDGVQKEALVKARLCPKCKEKVNTARAIIKGELGTKQKRLNNEEEEDETPSKRRRET
eukprot:Blabericola_migrator_1__6207@NODE_3132_length_2013_cov_178_662898_g1960_i0_p2_GENE_NODE_3132_length_2013_cov_178_662898_g1960_i0NODE_3132_length_2013_cov_178_662898_g1960_i0_p2_ORF_typecomplete_len223_score42_40Fra10Ac1/PF09725_9/3_3e40DUF3245/PF11595_8/0_3DUF3245/PF11595_8/1_7e02_NODE_3132_length_2013_cov_178_662898_g1960_i012321900